VPTLAAKKYAVHVVNGMVMLAPDVPLVNGRNVASRLRDATPATVVAATCSR
jgi:hypothetical protein